MINKTKTEVKCAHCHCHPHLVTRIRTKREWRFTCECGFGTEWVNGVGMAVREWEHANMVERWKKNQTDAVRSLNPGSGIGRVMLLDLSGEQIKKWEVDEGVFCPRCCAAVVTPPLFDRLVYWGTVCPICHYSFNARVEAVTEVEPLLPCPFCNTEPGVERNVCYCEACSFSTPFNLPDEPTARRVWNQLAQAIKKEILHEND